MPKLDDWNLYASMLTQALLGVISNNFRMVALANEGDQWVVEVWLDAESQRDSEEIADAVDEMWVFVEGVKAKLSKEAYRPIVSKIMVSQQSIDASMRKQRRVVFERRI